MKAYLHGISSWHSHLGYSDWLEDKPLIWRCWKGIKRVVGEPDKLDRQPITTTILQQMKSVLDTSTHYQSSLLWAAATTAAYGLFRMGEFCIDSKSSKYQMLTLSNLTLYGSNNLPISRHHIQEWDKITHYSILLLASKTDPFRKGVTIHIGNAIAVSALMEYLCKHYALSNDSSPLFQHQPNVALHRDTMIKLTRSALAAVGLDQSKYYGHSFRRGGATSLSIAGVPDSMIQTMGRWRSDCYKLYIATPLNQILKASRCM
jgi:hypothetical protein